MTSIMPYKAPFKRRHTASLRDLNLVTASILPSIQDVRELTISHLI